MFNQFTGIGNIASDPESRFTTSGKQVATFTVCCDSGYGEHKKTEFVRCVAWDKLAEIVITYLAKGSKCMVQGTMQTRKWQDQSGNDRYSTEIICQTMKMLSPRAGSGGGDSFPDPPPMGDDIPFD